MKRYARFTVALGLSLLVVAMLGACATTPTPTPPAEKTKIVIVHLTDLTGPYSGTLVHSDKSMHDYVEWTNDNNIIPGAELVARSYNTEMVPANFVTAYKKAMSETPQPVIVLPTGTTGVLAVKELCARDKVPIFYTVANEQVQTEGSWCFGWYPRNDGTIMGLLDYFLENQWDESRPPRFAYATWDNPYGRSIVTDGAIDYMKSRGVEFMGEVYIPQVPSDTMPLALQLKDWDVDVAGGFAFASSYQVFVKDLDRAGIRDQITLLTGCDLVLGQLREFVGPLADGVLHADININHSSEWPQYWQDKFFADGGEEKDAMAYNYGLALASGAVEVLRIAAEDVGAENIDGQVCYDTCFNEIKDFYGYFTVPNTFGDTSHSGHGLISMDYVRVLTLEDGEITNLEDLQYCPDVWPGGKDVVK